MQEKACRQCGKPIRPQAKFCPHCGAGQAAPGTEKEASGILSFDDFFDEEDATTEGTVVDETAGNKEKEPSAPKADQPSVASDVAASQEKPAMTPDETEAPKPEPKGALFFRDRDKRKKVKVLEDTLELPIEEIQKEIARRREKERLDARSDVQKMEDKRTMEGVYDKLRKDANGVLIPEEDILDPSDRPEKPSILGRLSAFVLGTKQEDIEGVDVKAVEEAERAKVEAARRGTLPETDAASVSTPTESATSHESASADRAEAAETHEAQEIPTGPIDLSEPKVSSDSFEETPAQPFWKRILGIQPEEPAETDFTATDRASETPADAFDDEPVSEAPARGGFLSRIFGQKIDTPDEEMPVGEGPAAPVEAYDGSEPEMPKETTPADRRRRLWIVGGAVGVVATFMLVFFLYGNYTSNPLRLSESFAAAVEENDADKMASLLRADGVSVTAESLAPLQALLQDPEYRENLLTKLASYDETDGKTPAADVWIESTGTQLLFFQSHTMKVRTFTVTPEVTYPNTMVTVDGGEPKALSPGDGQTIEGLLPGEHTLAGRYEGGLSPIASTAQVKLTTNEEEPESVTSSVDLKNPGKFAAFTSPQEEAVVRINGQDKGKAGDFAAEKNRLGPFEEPVSVQLVLTTPLGTAESKAVDLKDDGQSVEFDFPNLVEVSDYHDEAKLFINGEEVGPMKDWLRFHRMIGPVKPEDKVQMEMIEDGKLTKSSEVTVGDSKKLLFSYTKAFTFPAQYADAVVILDGVDTEKTVREMAGDDLVADILNSYENIQIRKTFPWGTFESDRLDLDEAKTLRFTINSMNDRLIRQLQDAVVTYLEEDAFAISNLRPNNYSNIEDPLLSNRQGYIQSLLDEGKRVIRSSDVAHFDMGSIQFDDEDGTYWARITEEYVYREQEYDGIFRPLRLEMVEKREVMQHAMRYDGNLGRWVIYENRPKDSIGERTEAIDLAY